MSERAEILSILKVDGIHDEPHPKSSRVLRVTKHGLSTKPFGERHLWYSSVQGAVECAREGDVIVIESGWYTESVIITKPLTLRGAESPDPTSPASSENAVILQASMTASTTVVLAAQSARLENLTIMSPAVRRSNTLGRHK
eukprot:488094_1